jgi:hypothetical protein
MAIRLKVAAREEQPPRSFLWAKSWAEANRATNALNPALRAALRNG